MTRRWASPGERDAVILGTDLDLLPRETVVSRDQQLSSPARWGSQANLGKKEEAKSRVRERDL